MEEEEKDGTGDDATTDRMIEVICSQLEVSSDKVRREARFVDDLGADSLAIVELVLAVEEAFELEIPDEDQEQLPTVGAAIDYIKSRVR